MCSLCQISALEHNNDKSIRKIKYFDLITSSKERYFNLIILQDGRIGASTYKYSIVILNQNTLNCIFEIVHAHDSIIYYLSQLNNQKLLSSSKDTAIKIWNLLLKKFSLETVIRGHTSDIYKAIPITKNRIASCSLDSSIRIWEGLKPYNQVTSFTQDGAIRSIIQLKSKVILLSGSNAQTLLFWDLTNNKKIALIQNVTCNSMNAIYEISNGKVIIGNCDIQNILLIVNILTYQIETLITDSIFIEKDTSSWFGVFSFMEIEDSIIVGCPNGNYYQISITDYKCLSKGEHLHQDSIEQLSLINEKAFISISVDGVIKKWCWETK